MREKIPALIVLLYGRFGHFVREIWLSFLMMLLMFSLIKAAPRRPKSSGYLGPTLARPFSLRKTSGTR